MHATGGEASPTLAHLDVTTQRGRHRTTFTYTVAVYELPAVTGFLDTLASVPQGALPAELTHLSLESSAFESRCELGVGAKSDANRARQLFSPSFLAWLTEEAPAGLSFELCSGLLCVWKFGGLDTTEELDRFRACADRIAARTAEEAAEATTLT
jgi:hypothetical protein